jgi:hypothetical protein
MFEDAVKSPKMLRPWCSSVDVASALCADSFEPEARRYNFCGRGKSAVVAEAKTSAYYKK